MKRVILAAATLGLGSTQAFGQTISNCGGAHAPAGYAGQVCASTCVYAAGTLTCTPDTGAGGANVGILVEDYDQVGTTTYSSYGNRNNGTLYCCYIDDSATHNIVTAVLQGGPTSDTLAFTDLGASPVRTTTTPQCQAWGEGDTDYLTGSKRHSCTTAGCWDDILDGGDEDDFLFGLAGRDLISGQGGIDYVEGGLGDDGITGGNGADILYGDGGNDDIDGGDNADEIHGGPGADHLTGAEGDDTSLSGDAGDDFIDGGLGNDWIDGGDDDDILWGSSGNDTVYGGSGGDILCGGTSAVGGGDYLKGGLTGNGLEFPNVVDVSWSPSGATATGSSQTGDTCGDSSAGAHPANWAGSACSYTVSTKPADCN